VKISKYLLLIILPVLFFILPSITNAQSEIDKCFNYLQAQDYARAIEAGKKAVKLYPKNTDPYFCLGRAYASVGEFKLALTNMKEAERLAKNKNDLMYIYNWLGLIYKDMGDLDNALLYNDRSLNLAKELGNRNVEATMLNNIAGILDKKGEYDKALRYYEEALRLTANEKDKSTTYNNMAIIYSKIGDFKKAVDYLKKAIEIAERYGDYHGLAKYLLNLGNTYRKAGDFSNAEIYLLDGLNRIRKLNDKYWEAGAYIYLGYLYRDKGDKQTAKDYLTKAYNLFKSIGAEADANDALFSLMELEKRKSAIYGGVEIGSKGVKAIALEILMKNDELYDIKELFRENINTTIISGVKETGTFSSDSINETAEAVKTLINKIQEKGVPKENIFIIASSAITSVKNKEALSDKIKELTGYNTNFLTTKDEVLYNIAGALPVKYYYNSIVVDIGSGNTKIGYLEKVADNINVKSLEIPYGSVSLTEEAKKRGNLNNGLNEILNKEVIVTLKKEVQKNPAYINRNNVFLLGGAVWALTTLQKPEQINESYVKLTAKNIEDFLNNLKKNPDKALNPDISRLKPEIKQQAQKQIEKVKDVFTVDNLNSGLSLLSALSKELKFSSKQIMFPRYGNWLIGFVMLNGYWIEKEANK
jgi:tetratricopeptide (TPR) repeat protein